MILGEPTAVGGTQVTEIPAAKEQEFMVKYWNGLTPQEQNTLTLRELLLKIQKNPS